MSSKPCFKWRYRIRFAAMTGEQYSQLIDACIASFNAEPCRNHRWDITAVRRVGWKGGSRYSRITLHFKHCEDLVLFKFCYDMVK